MNHGDLEDSFLTVAEVAQTLKLNPQTVRNWIDQGSLPALRVGRRVRIRRSDFDRLLSDSYTAGAAAAGPTSPTAEDFWGGEAVGVPEPSAPALVHEPGTGPEDPDGAARAPLASPATE
jgi:excisionase family DNA binding protein